MGMLEQNQASDIGEMRPLSPIVSTGLVGTLGPSLRQQNQSWPVTSSETHRVLHAGIFWVVIWGTPRASPPRSSKNLEMFARRWGTCCRQPAGQSGLFWPSA